MFHLISSPIENFKFPKTKSAQKTGAVVRFEGIVRKFNDGKTVTALAYEADKKLCAKEFSKIEKEAKSRFKILHLNCIHRVGRISVGKTAVAIETRAPHRGQAFDACRYTIDELKKRLPIWKKEFYKNGSSGWIGI